MKCSLQLLLSIVAAAAPSVLNESLSRNALKRDKRTVAISSHADVDNQVSAGTLSKLKQTVVVDADADLHADPDQDRAEQLANKERSRMMRAERQHLESSALEKLDNQDDCEDLLGATRCSRRIQDCDDPFRRTFMVRSCRKTCGICTSSESPIKCSWSSWHDWAKCDESCGGGVQYRKRTIQRPASNGGDECMGPREETSDCNNAPCPTTTTIASAPAVAQANVARVNVAPNKSKEKKKKEQVLMLVGFGSLFGVVLVGIFIGSGLSEKKPQSGRDRAGTARNRCRTDTTLTQWTVPDDDDYIGDDYDEVSSAYK